MLVTVFLQKTEVQNWSLSLLIRMSKNEIGLLTCFSKVVLILECCVFKNQKIHLHHIVYIRLFLMVAPSFSFFFPILYFTSIVIVYNSYTVQNNMLIKIDGMVSSYIVEITNSYKYYNQK